MLSYCTTANFAPLLLSACWCVAASAGGPSVHIGSTVVGRTNERYASYNVDGSWNRGFFHVNWSNANLRAAATSLACVLYAFRYPGLLTPGAVAERC
mgnify:CR=1 FL=1